MLREVWNVLPEQSLPNAWSPMKTSRHVVGHGDRGCRPGDCTTMRAAARALETVCTCRRGASGLFRRLRYGRTLIDERRLLSDHRPGA